MIGQEHDCGDGEWPILANGFRRLVEAVTSDWFGQDSAALVSDNREEKRPTGNEQPAIVRHKDECSRRGGEG